MVVYEIGAEAFIMIRQTLLISGLLGLLAGCQSSPVKNIHSPFFAPPAGSILQLHTAIEIPRNELSVIIQYGKIQPSTWELDRYYPNCDFEIRDKHNAVTQIKPDRFEIIKSIQDTEHVLLAPARVADIGFSGGPPHEEYQTIMYLHSEKQPNVFRMTCRHWEDPTDGEHLSVARIREALGKLFSLKLPGE